MLGCVLNASLAIDRYEIDLSVWCDDAQLEMVVKWKTKLKDQNQNWVFALSVANFLKF